LTVDASADFGVTEYFDGEYFDGEYIQDQGIEFTLTAAVEGFTDFASNQSAQFAQSVTAKLTADATVDLQSTAAITVAPDKLVDGSATLSAQFTQTQTADLFKPVDAEFDTVVTVTATLNGTQRITKTLETAFLFDNTTTLFKNFDSTLDNTATVSATVGLLESATVNLNTAFTQTVDEDLFKNFNSTLDTVSTQTVDEDLFKNFESDLDTAFTQTAEEDLFKNFDSDLSAVATVSLEPTITRGITETLQAESQLFAFAQARFSASSSTIALFTPTITVNAQFVEETQLQSASTLVTTVGVIKQGFVNQVTGAYFNGTTAEILYTDAEILPVDPNDTQQKLNRANGGSGTVIAFWAKLDPTGKFVIEQDFSGFSSPDTGVWEFKWENNQWTHSVLATTPPNTIMNWSWPYTTDGNWHHFLFSVNRFQRRGHIIDLYIDGEFYQRDTDTGDDGFVHAIEVINICHQMALWTLLHLLFMHHLILNTQIEC